MIWTICEPDVSTYLVLVRPSVCVLQTHEQAVVSALVEPAALVRPGDGIGVRLDVTALKLAEAVTIVLLRAVGVYLEVTVETASEFRVVSVCTPPVSNLGRGWKRTFAPGVVGSLATVLLGEMTEYSPNAAIAAQPVMSIGAMATAVSRPASLAFATRLRQYS
jgi:hypothetical protein